MKTIRTNKPTFAPKKIVYIIDELNIGGTEKQLIATIERLDKENFVPILVCLRSSPFLKDFTACTSHVLGVNSLLSLDGISKIISFSLFLRKSDVDIVQTFFFDSTVFGVLSAKLAGVKKIISCRRDMGFWYTPKLLAVLRIVNRFTHRILVNSQAIKENVVLREGLPSSKVDVIYNGIDLGPFQREYDTKQLRNQLGIKKNDKVVGIVANLNRRVKRVDVFIEAASFVLKYKKNVSFVIIGSGYLQGELEKLANDIGICDKIFFVGSINNVVPYLYLFDIAVLSSESEGMSNAIIEYMAAGLPVVCMAGGGNDEIIVDGLNGYLCDDICCLSEKILLLLNDQILSMRFSENNRRRIMIFSWESVVEKINDYYTID